MKRHFTSLHILFQGAFKGMLCVPFVLFLCSSAIGQSFAANEFGYLKTVNWKATADLDNAIATEQSRMTVALSAPNIQQDEKSLYLSYKRLLNHVQTNLQAGAPVDEAITKSYEQVLTEIPTDASLKDAPEGVLFTYLPGLVEIFTKPVTAGQ